MDHQELQKTDRPDTDVGSLPALICFGREAWGYDAPSMEVAEQSARTWTTVYLERAIEVASGPPRLQTVVMLSGVSVARPLIPAGRGASKMAAEQSLFDELIEDHIHSPLIFWFMTAGMVSLTLHREPSLCVFDWTGGLKHSSKEEERAKENTLLAIADLVFVDDTSDYRPNHPRVHPIPVSWSAARSWAHKIDIVMNEFEWSRRWQILFSRLQKLPAGRS